MWKSIYDCCVPQFAISKQFSWNIFKTFRELEQVYQCQHMEQCNFCKHTRSSFSGYWKPKFTPCVYKGGAGIYLDLVASKHDMQCRLVLGAGPGGAVNTIITDYPPPATTSCLLPPTSAAHLHPVQCLVHFCRLHLLTYAPFLLIFCLNQHSQS